MTKKHARQENMLRLDTKKRSANVGLLECGMRLKMETGRRVTQIKMVG